MKSKAKSAGRTTRVTFRKYSDGQVIVLFPDIPWNKYRGEVTSYMHLGQHSGADYSGTIAATRPASENEYSDLLDELRSAGYENFNIVKQLKA